MRTLFGLLCIIFILFIQLTVVVPATELTIEEQILTFTNISKSDRSIILDIPKDAEVSYFGFELRGPVQAGSEQPWKLSLDVGDNGSVSWSLKREYGPLGAQQVFNNGAQELALRFIPGNYNTSGGFYLPKGAEVSEARMELEFFEEDYISPGVTELNRPEWHPEAPYDYDPEMCIYQDRLYVVYRTYSWYDTNQSDADIAMNSTHDGIHWAEKTIELTKAPDTEVPYLGGKKSGDFNPSLAVFKNQLYCAWESDSPLPMGSTTNTDRDILWTCFNGITWCAPQELTALDAQAGEDIYSKNPGVKDDYNVQLCTFNNGSAEQLFAIWAANNTGDEEFPGERIGDIVVSHTVDGEHWATGFDLTANDKRYDVDYLPQLIEFPTQKGNALFAFWVTNNEKLSNGTDWEIVYRYTLDGNSWSEYFNLMEMCGIIESENDLEAIDDDPYLTVFDNKLYVLWRTSNPIISDGTDIDIVFANTEDGFNWSKPTELTDSSDVLFNNRPRAVGYKNKLVACWRAVTQDDAGAIVIKIFDKTTQEWLPAQTISPKGSGDNDYSPDIITFEDKVMLAWVTEDNSTTLGDDSDVVVRWLMPRNGTPELALDIGLGGYYNENWLWTKTTYSEGGKYTLGFTDRILYLLSDSNWLNSNTIYDEFGNGIIYIPINTYFSSPGRIKLSSLEIQYNYTIGIPDLSTALTGYMKDANAENSGDNIKVKLRFDSISNGKVKIQNLRVEYTTPTKTQQYPELVCIAIIGIVLILLGLVIKFSKVKPKRRS